MHSQILASHPMVVDRVVEGEERWADWLGNWKTFEMIREYADQKKVQKTRKRLGSHESSPRCNASVSQAEGLLEASRDLREELEHLSLELSQDWGEEVEEEGGVIIEESSEESCGGGEEEEEEEEEQEQEQEEQEKEEKEDELVVVVVVETQEEDVRVESEPEHEPGPEPEDEGMHEEVKPMQETEQTEVVDSIAEVVPIPAAATATTTMTRSSLPPILLWALATVLSLAALSTFFVFAARAGARCSELSRYYNVNDAEEGGRYLEDKLQGMWCGIVDGKGEWEGVERGVVTAEGQEEWERRWAEEQEETSWEDEEEDEGNWEGGRRWWRRLPWVRNTNDKSSSGGGGSSSDSERGNGGFWRRIFGFGRR